MKSLRPFLLSALAVIATASLAVQAQVPGVNSTLDTVFNLVYDASTMKQTFSASVAGVTSPNNGGDVCSLYGSATKTLKVRRAIVSGFASALQTDPISIVKRSTISNGGTVNATAMSVVAYDTNNTASTAITDVYTTAPTTLGTLTGILIDRYVNIAGATTSVANQPSGTFVFGELGQPIVLRGVSQSINVNTIGLASFTISCTFEWTEE